MINYLSQNELCYSIFSIKLDHQVQYSSLRPKLQSLIRKGKFPILDFKKYQNDYKNGIDLLILLKKHKFSFPFDKEFLDEFSQQDNQSINEMSTSPDYIVLIVLHCFISWYINFTQTHSTSDILILLRSLLIVMNIKNCKIISKHRSYAASAFINIYSEITESIFFTNVIDILPPVIEYLTMNNDIPQNSFDILLKLSHRIIDPNSTQFTKETSHFANFIVIIVRTCGNRFPNYITSDIVSQMSNSLIGLDKDALSFFGRSIQTLGSETAFPIISKLPNSIMAKIIESKNPIFICNSTKNDQGLVFPANNVVFENKLVPFVTFETDICDLIKTAPYFPDILSPEELISRDILEIFDLIYKIVENEEKLKEILIKNIMSLLSTCSISPHYYDINAAFLYFLLILSKNCKIESISKDIFLSHLFRQNETIFNHDDGFQKVNTIRQFAFLLLINQQQSVILKTLLTIRLKPYTFAEFVYRLLPDMNNLEKLLEISIPVFEGVMTAIVFYQKFQNLNEEMNKASCVARIAGFTYIDIMLKIPDFRKKFFESSMCVDAMISLVFEENVRNWALLKIIDAFYLENTSLTYLIESCLKLFNISCDFGFTKGETHQLDSLIRFLDHDVFNSSNQNDLLKSFEPVISSICGWVAGLIQFAFTKSDPQYSINSKDYYIHSLNELMKILTRFSDVHTLSQSDISLIDATASFLYNNEPSDEFFNHLICTIAGEFLPSIDPSFDIKQPKAMKLIICLFDRSEYFLSKINFIISLCNYSTKNCERLQKGEFDLFLVSHLFVLRNRVKIESDVFKQALLLLRLISANSCSVSFVHQYVSLFCPIECKTLPRFHQEILDSMQTLLQNSVKVPVTPLPIFSTTQVSATDIKISKAFTVFFWFFIYNNEESITIAQIINNESKFSIQFINKNVTISYQNANEKWSDVPSFDLPTNQWSLATFSVHDENNKIAVKTSINGNIQQTKYFPYFDLSENLSEVNVGITNSNELTILLGSFGITKFLDPSQNVSFYDSGPRKVPKRSLFFFIPHNKNDNYEIEVIPSTVNATIQKVRALHQPSFADILIDICGVSILIPIIANIDLTYKNGYKNHFLLEQFIEILEISLSLSSHSQQLFASDKGFLMISHILLASKFIELNYKVFYRFCSLFELLENEKCRSHLLFGILMKLDLWIRCDAANLKRILHYWDKTLAQLHLPFIMSKISFNDIITSLRIFLWYDSSEHEVILHELDRKIFQIEDIKQCRQYLFSIAYMMLMEKGLTTKDFKLIISQILSLDDKEQIIDLLLFVDDLIVNKDKLVKNSENVMESIVYLMFLYSTDLEVIEQSLNIVIKAYNMSLITEMNLSDHFEIMIQELPGSYAYPSVLIKLLEICSTKEPKLFPLCSMIAFSFGQNSFSNLLDVLKPNELYCSNSLWSLWTIISLFQMNDQAFQNRILTYLIEISPSQWTSIFWSIDNIGRCLNTNYEQMKKRFILKLGNYLLNCEEQNDEYLDQFFNLVLQFLFLCSNFQINNSTEINIDKSVHIDRNETDKNIQINNNQNENSDSNKNDISSDSYENNFHSQSKRRRSSGNRTGLKNLRSSQIFYRRRSSFQSFDSSSFSSTKEKFMNLDFIQLKLTSFITMVKYNVEKTDYKLYYGLRINKENEWEDIDVARIANQLFKKFPKKSFFNSCLFLNAFMLHFDHNDALEAVNSFNINDYNVDTLEISLFNKHADSLHYKILLNEEPSSYLQKSNQVIQQFENKYHENNSLLEMYTYLVNYYEREKKLYYNYENEISQITTEIIADFKEDLSLKNTKYSKIWTHFWRAMTIERAPWHYSLPEEQKMMDIYFKRDFILCSSMCPFRMRPNNSFNNHKDASQKRDVEPNNPKQQNLPISKTGSLRCMFSSQSSLNSMKTSLYTINNSILLESTSDFSEEQLRIFNKNDQVELTKDTIIFDLEKSKCIFESTCEIITVTHSYDALFSLQKECIVIKKSDKSAHVIKNEEITAVLMRTVLHRETAIEIFLDNGLSFFVNFIDIKSSEIIKQFKILKKSLQNPFFLQTKPPKQLLSLSKCTTLWQNKKITNFDYLMILNMLSGRSFNYPSQYPYFPWILTDYSSETIDLNNPEIYRDLSKPIGTLGKEKFEQLKMVFESLPYLYSNGNVSPLIVFLWLVRVEPFTTLQIKDQDGSFDAPDRQFKSIEKAFQSVLTLSSDFRELIPEFFFQPEFLVNMNNFDLGISAGKRVNDVELPKWINTESKEPIVAAYEFIYMHRKALESDHVSAHLNEWIDLTWGDKSRGQKAIESDNVYSPEMYPEVWDNQSDSELENNIPTIEAILSYVGQIPIQLFNKPHPQRSYNTDKTIFDNVYSFKTRNSKSKIIIGTIISSTDMKTIEIFSIDENGVCSENDFEINSLLKSSNNSNSNENEQQTNQKSYFSSAQKFISHFSSKSTNAHLDPSILYQIIWKPAFHSSPMQRHTSLFVPSNGFKMQSSKQSSIIHINGPNSNTLWKKFFIVDSSQKSDLYLVDPKDGRYERIVRMRNDITAISTDGFKWLAVANKDSKIYIYSLENLIKTSKKNDSNEGELIGHDSLLKVEFTIPSFRDYVKCCDISTNFHYLVCGTRDNSLMICSMSSHSILKIVELDAKPIILAVTPSWGFIVVYLKLISDGKCTRFMAVFGTNGYLLRKVEVENSIKKIITWKDENGFDFVIFTDGENKIYVFEAFYCNIGKPIYETSSTIVDISYIEGCHSAVVLCEDGTAHIIPIFNNLYIK